MARRLHRSAAALRGAEGPSPLGAGFWAGLHIAFIVVMVALALSAARAEAAEHDAESAVADQAMASFAAHCFSPFLTAETAAERLAAPGVRVAFYDLRPFSDVAISPVVGRAATPGTDRRCEVAFDGAHGVAAAAVAVAALDAEGITDPAPLPEGQVALPGTELLAARFLNPARIAVVHVGDRPGPAGVETFLTVERMAPLGAVEEMNE